MRNPLQKLDDNNIRSYDLEIGEQIQDYLRGDISKKECRVGIKSRLKEINATLKGATKLLDILKECPANVESQEVQRDRNNWN